MLSEKEFEALAFYYHGSHYGNGWMIRPHALLDETQNAQFVFSGWIERLEEPNPLPHFRITQAGITAYWVQMYHYVKGTVYQLRELSHYAITNCKTAEDYKQKFELAMMIISGEIEWTDKGILPISNKPKEKYDDETR